MPLWDYDNAPMTDLQIAALAVFSDKTKKLEDYPEDYQLKIKSTWRFAAHRFTTKGSNTSPRSPETLDFT
jgi:hypothetical protein